MNITDNNLRASLQLFENKLASMWQLDGQLMECVDDERVYKLERRQITLNNEVDRARENLIAAIEQYKNDSGIDIVNGQTYEEYSNGETKYDL